MLTDEQRLALAEQLKQGVGRVSQVSPEQMAEYPAALEELEVPTTQGPAKVYQLTYGIADEHRPLFLNFHGGGFIGRHMDRDELFCRRMACTFGALVLDVDYKLAPANPYPVAVNECWDVVEWAWNNRETLKYDPDKIVLIGHSSGGNLVAGICMHLNEKRLFTPSCIVLDYPPLDLKQDPADKPLSICDMPAQRAQDYNAKYIIPAKADDPYVSPVLAPNEMLENFPDTLIISAGEDRLCAEDEVFALRLARCGNTVTFKRFTESIHGFVINRMCEWESATALILSFISNHLN